MEFSILHNLQEWKFHELTTWKDENVIISKPTIVSTKAMQQFA